MQVQTLECPVGTIAARWSNQGLYAFEFQRPSAPSAKHEVMRNGPQQWQLQQSLDDYFVSGAFNVDLSMLDWSDVSEFHQKVLRHCFGIPTGETLTYGQLAQRSGSPLAARAVGAAMARNRWPILIPCHRVVGANGSLTGYSGLGGIDTKRRLLELERQVLFVG